MRKRHFLAVFILNIIFLPSQARDKHRENSKKGRFLAGIHIQAGGPFNNESRLHWLRSNVTLVRNHPALLGYLLREYTSQIKFFNSLAPDLHSRSDHSMFCGRRYYICDDCCGSHRDVSMQAQVYSVIKDLDPYHATIGAANCGNSFLFRDIPSLLPATVNRSTAWMEHGQPALQLSLDLVMQVRALVCISFWISLRFNRQCSTSAEQTHHVNCGDDLL